MRGHSDYTNKDYVLGGHYETVIDGEGGIYKVVMKLVVKLQKPSDFGIFKCVAKNALGSSEEIIKILRKFLFGFSFFFFLLHKWKVDIEKLFKKTSKSLWLPRYAWLILIIDRESTISSNWFQFMYSWNVQLWTNIKFKVPRLCLKCIYKDSLTFSYHSFVYSFRHIFRWRNQIHWNTEHVAFELTHLIDRFCSCYNRNRHCFLTTKSDSWNFREASRIISVNGNVNICFSNKFLFMTHFVTKAKMYKFSWKDKLHHTIIFFLNYFHADGSENWHQKFFSFQVTLFR